MLIRQLRPLAFRPRYQTNRRLFSLPSAQIASCGRTIDSRSAIYVLCHQQPQTTFPLCDGKVKQSRAYSSKAEDLETEYEDGRGPLSPAIMTLDGTLKLDLGRIWMADPIPLAQYDQYTVSRLIIIYIFNKCGSPNLYDFG